LYFGFQLFSRIKAYEEVVGVFVVRFHVHPSPASGGRQLAARAKSHRPLLDDQLPVIQAACSLWVQARLRL
jgi:hypothetical protein